MGIEDRDWYREKQIDWDRGGLRERRTGRGRSPHYRWWVLIIMAMLLLAALFEYH